MTSLFISAFLPAALARPQTPGYHDTGATADGSSHRPGVDASTSPDPKRRKIRKGTRSCWACKRKKTRCTFSSEPSPQPAAAAASDAPASACDGCRRRGIACVSQDLPESLSPAAGGGPVTAAASTTTVTAALEENDRLKDRLQRMEMMVEKLVETAAAGAAAPAARASPAAVREPWSRRRRSRSRSWDGQSRSSGPPAASVADGGERDASEGEDDVGALSTSPAGRRASHRSSPNTTSRRSGGPAAAARRPDGIPTPSDTDDAAYVTITTDKTTASERVREYAPTTRPGTTDTSPGAGSHEQITYMTWFGHERNEADDGTSFPLAKPLGVTLTPASSTTAGAAGQADGPGVRATAARPSDRRHEEAAAAPTPASAPKPHAATESPGYRWGSPAAHAEYMRRYDQLVAAWPAREDIDVVLAVLAGPRRCGVFGMLTFVPTLSLELFRRSRTASRSRAAGATDALTAADLLVLPPPGVPLVLLAQRLLLLATILQHLHKAFHPALGRLRVARGPRNEQLLGAVGRAVLSDDLLTTSVEGLQCLIALGDVQANAGQLRRAWMTFQQALAVARLLGLHRAPVPVPGAGPTAAPAGTGSELEDLTALAASGGPAALAMRGRVLDAIVAPGCLWFRTVHADRMLSLMLGLPQGAPGDRAITISKALSTAPDKGMGTAAGMKTAAAAADFARQQDFFFQIAQAHAIIVGRIIDRNEAWRNGDDGEADEADEADEAGEAADEANEGAIAAAEDDENGQGGNNSSSCRRSHQDRGGGGGHRRATAAIDMLLQRASRSMPVQWWLTPQLSAEGAAAPTRSAADGNADSAAAAADDDDDGHMRMFLRARHFLCQVFHYSLLTQLHLPYMLQRGVGAEAGAAGAASASSYSTITCISASREVLQRFLQLRGIQPTAMYCRSTDFFALLSSMTLCLAHIDCHRRLVEALNREAAAAAAAGANTKAKTPRGPRLPPGTNDVLFHQRLSDRAMMEHVLACLDDTARLCDDDVLTGKGAAFLRRILAVEAVAYTRVGAAMGCSTSAAALAEHARAGGDGSDGVRVVVPLLGTISITKDGIRRVADGSGEGPAVPPGPDRQPQQQPRRAGPGPLPAAQPLSSSTSPPPDTTAPAAPQDAPPREEANVFRGFLSLASGLQGSTMPHNSRWAGGGAALFAGGSMDAGARTEAAGVPAGTGVGLPAALYGDPYGGGFGANRQAGGAVLGGFDGGADAASFANGGPPPLFPQPPLDRQPGLAAAGGGGGGHLDSGNGGGSFWDLQGVDYAFFENLLLDQRLDGLDAFGAGAGAATAPAPDGGGGAGPSFWY